MGAILVDRPVAIEAGQVVKAMADLLEADQEVVAMVVLEAEEVVEMVVLEVEEVVEMVATALV
ncbi:hypothetical protein [Minwuia sp. IMCC3077]|uniref:hypothetical protein n=1 Tax=Minwuia sp. IMCC3077 TaxID=3040676 RepID=UPI00247A2992|nr:hypothetical protein [Minwuia sp. IMCC3077]